MKNKLFMRTVCGVMALVMLSTTATFTVLADEKTNTAKATSSQETSDSDLDAESTISTSENSYTSYREKYAKENRPAVAEDEGYIYGNGKTAFTPGDKAEIAEKTVDGRKALEWSNQEGSVTFDVNVKESGVYSMKASYEIMAGGATSVELGLLIDGKSPYETASRITLNKRWVDDGEITQDINGNDIRPGQIEEVCWQEILFEDIDGLYGDPLWFYLEKGNHKITLKSIKAKFALEYLKLAQPAELKDYEAPSKADLEKNADADVITLEGEDADYKSDRTLYPTSDKNSSITSPSDPTKIKYNTLGAKNWSQATQSATWKVDVKTAGYYKIGVRARQDQMRGFYSNRRLMIDGVVPNKESDQIKFYYNTDWAVTSAQDKDGNDMYYYLDAGEHELTLEAVPGEIGEVMAELDAVVYNVTSYYRQVRQITGPSPDEYNNYMIDIAIPTIVDDFKKISKTLMDKKAYIESLTGTAGTEAVTLEKMAIVLDNCVDRPDNIPTLLSQIKDNITAVSSWMREYRNQFLEVDFIQLAPEDKDFSSVDEGFIDGLKFGFDAFIGSFFEDYNSLSEKSDESLVCWVALGRDQAQVINSMVDSDFNPNSDTKVTVNLVQGGIVEATLAGKGPDIALFIGGDFPIQLAARGVLTDLSTFSDYEDVKTRFQKDATVLYEYNNGSYGLPVSQDFPMLFYRSDILAENGIDPKKDLQTWDGLINVLPVLQRNYMEVGLILPIVQNLGNGVATVATTTEAGSTFASLLLQQGLNFYNADKTKTTFDSQEAMNAFKTWTKFYSTYSFQQTYDAFSRFRTGDYPIMIQNYIFYNQVAVAAPEIKGCWDFMQVPGTVQKDGTISHASNSAGNGAIIFKKAKNQDAAWDFVKWFTSTESQVQYANDIEALMGTLGRFQTANVKALNQLSWSTNEVEKLQAQLSEQVEIPIIPATYAVTRNIMNAFRETVNNASNSSDTLMQYNKDINSEIKRKLEDLDMYSDDNN